MRDNTETKIIYKGQAMIDADELRETAKSDICDHYCRYGAKINGLGGSEGDQILEHVCITCPLAYL